MCLRTLGDHPEFQQRLRDDHRSISPFIEEMLRTEAPLKGSFKLSKVRTTVGGVEMAAGNHRVRDDRRREPRSPPVRVPERVPARPAQRASAPRVRARHPHLRGAPLARAETHATLVRFLERMSDIRISEAHHGPPGARRYDYDRTYMLRGLTDLHLEFTPSA